MIVDVSNGWELHNVIKDADGQLRTRRGFAATLDFSGNDIVAAFSVENPKTTEVWWYLFIWSSTDGTIELRVFDEGREFGSTPLFSYPLGKMSRDVVITMARAYDQIQFNSPSFSAPLHGFVGGGVSLMVAVPSINPDSTTLSPPTGHCASFGDRWAVAQDNAVYFCDPGIQGLRSFVATNVTVLPGTILDMFETDAGLFFATTNGAFSLARDALSVGQDVVGFVSSIDGISTTAPRNACSTSYGTVVLGRDSISVVGGNGVTKLPIPRYQGRRRLSRPVEVDDLRTHGRLFSTPDGFLLGFGRARDMFLSADMRTGTFSWHYGTDSQNQPTALHGVLWSRDGDQFLAFQSTVVQSLTIGASDSWDDEMRGYICGLLPVDCADQPLFRRVVVAAANAGGTLGVAMAPAENVSMTTPTHTGDVVIGTDLWESKNFQSYSQRTVRATVNVRTTEPHLEIVVGGCGRRISSTIDLEMSGNWRKRKDRQP